MKILKKMILKIISLLLILMHLFIKTKNAIYSYRTNYLYSNINKEYFGKDDVNSNILNQSFSLFNGKNNFNEKNIYYNISDFKYILSFRFNIIEVKFNILFFYKNKSLIIPSDLSLHHDLHLICHMKKIESNLSLDSLAYIHLNKYFQCIEYIYTNEKINFGIKIYKPKNDTSCINHTQYFFNDNIFNYNNHFYQTNKFFFPLYIKKEFYSKNKNISLSLKRHYIKYPIFNIKSYINNPYNEWKFLNIYNHYFCFCQGNDCLYYNLLNIKNTTQICKYKFYLNLIEENKYLYNKTDFLLADFPGDFQSLDDAFPIFQALIKLNKNAYYMTINKNLIENKNIDEKISKYIIKGNFINGDFLEKYFTLFLRLKAVVSGAEYISFNNLFYYIDYITFISLTHGLNYFKTDLFRTYYGRSKYHKLVISTSEKLIHLAINNGWQEKDLIKICLPKWDKLDEIKKIEKRNKNKSIFFFFTWRLWNKNISDELKLNSDYFKNIEELINDKYLTHTLSKNKIALYFCLHHMLEIYEEKLNFSNENIKFIKQNEIFSCISNSNLLVTDFSSIIFEFIYLNKPYIMFIPDSEELNINKYYSQEYVNLIKGLKDGSIDFMNKFFGINQVLDKILYYINNDFQIEQSLVEFYKSFNLKCGNNTMKFINYLENL